MITTTPTRLAHVAPSPPRLVKDSMVLTAIGERSEPIITMPMAIAMIVITTELIERPLLAMIFQIILIVFKGIHFYYIKDNININLKGSGWEGMKFLIRVEPDIVRTNKLKRGNRSMVSVYSKLYPVFNHIMVQDDRSDCCYAIYPSDDTQPLMPEPVFLDPDYTIALIDSAKNSGGKKSIWANLTGGKLTSYMTVVVIAVALLWGFLSAGGL